MYFAYSKKSQHGPLTDICTVSIIYSFDSNLTLLDADLYSSNESRRNVNIVDNCSHARLDLCNDYS